MNDDSTVFIGLVVVTLALLIAFVLGFVLGALVL